MLADLFSHKTLHVAAVWAANGELWARSKMFQFIGAFELLAAEVTIHRTVAAVGCQVLIKKAAFELGSATIAA